VTRMIGYDTGILDLGSVGRGDVGNLEMGKDGEGFDFERLPSLDQALPVKSFGNVERKFNKKQTKSKQRTSV
jgi:hypothetical protein